MCLLFKTIFLHIISTVIVHEEEYCIHFLNHNRINWSAENISGFNCTYKLQYMATLWPYWDVFSFCRMFFLLSQEIQITVCFLKIMETFLGWILSFLLAVSIIIPPMTQWTDYCMHHLLFWYRFTWLKLLPLIMFEYFIWYILNFLLTDLEVCNNGEKTCLAYLRPLAILLSYEVPKKGNLLRLIPVGTMMNMMFSLISWHFSW